MRAGGAAPPSAARALWGSTERRRILYAALAAVALFALGALVRPGFASPGSIGAVLVVASFVGLVAAGQTFVILIGGIDLSVPWVLNAAAILLATSSLGHDARAIYGIVLTLGMGALVGSCNGVGIALFGVPPVVMTLAANGIMEGLTLGLSSGLTCPSCASYAPPVVQAAAHARLAGVPVVLLIWLVVIALVSAVLTLTRFGRSTYAIGNNMRASFLAGIHVKATQVALYGLSGFFAAFAGIMLVGFGGQASLGIGDPYLFQSIAAVVIGGVYILGGRGHYLGAVFGSISLVALISVLMALNMPEYGRSIIYGVIILLLLLLYGREAREG